MKKILTFFLIPSIFISQFACPLQAAVKEKEPIPSAITYEFSGGRFGDNLLAYLHAKWASFILKKPLFFKPFKHSDKLAMHYKETYYNKNIELRYAKSKTFYRGMALSDIKSFNIFYTIPYFPECMMEFERPHHQFPYFAVDWKDPQFIEIMWDCLTPIFPLEPLPLPEDRLTVAIHVRSWKWFAGDEQSRYALPLKLPPLEYYYEQLYQLTSFLDLPLYVYLFTDDPDPLEVLDYLKQAVVGYDVEFACRDPKLNVDKIVIEDFFAMTQFDCMIRSASNFSLIASKLGQYFIEISPKSCKGHGDHIKITDVNFEYNPDNLRKHF